MLTNDMEYNAHIIQGTMFAFLEVGFHLGVKTTAASRWFVIFLIFHKKESSILQNIFEY